MPHSALGRRARPGTAPEQQHQQLLRVCACDACLARVRDAAREKVLARGDPARLRAGKRREDDDGGDDGEGCAAAWRQVRERGRVEEKRRPLSAQATSAQRKPPPVLQRSFLVNSKAARRRLGRARDEGVDSRIRDLERIFGMAEKRGISRAKLRAHGESPRQWRTRQRKRRLELAGEHRFAAVQVQRIWRGYRARMRTQKLVRRVCAAQALVRGHLVRRAGLLERLRKERDAATKVQRIARARIARRKVAALRGARAEALRAAARHQELLECASAEALQSVWRGSVARHSYTRRRASAVTVQSLFRRRCASREMDARRTERRRRSSAILHIQRVVRGFQTREALRAAREDVAARVIEKLMRWYLNRTQLRLHRLRKDNLRDMWQDLGQEPSGEAGIKVLLDNYPIFDRNEAAVHAALYAIFARRNFDEAVDLVQSHATENDPRARYLRALAMRLGGRGAPGVLVQIVGRGKQLELDDRFREDRVVPRVFFGPGRTTALPCMEELEFLLRLAVQMAAADDRERAKRVCVHGVFRHLIVKDTDGAERMLLEAASLTPDDPFVTMCFYGRAAAPDEPLPSPGLCEEDFAGSGALCVLVREGVQLRDFEGIRVAVLERRSKRGRVDLMFSLSKSALGPEGGECHLEPEAEAKVRKTLIVSFSQLREWASFLDQPEAVTASGPQQAVALYEELVDSLDVVRTDRDEATWATVEVALRFKQRPVGTRVQLTRGGHLLSLSFFLEEQLRLRVTAYCAALDDSFAVVLGKTQIEALCVDSPLLKRMFATRGWRRATHFSPLLDRVARLLELCDPPPETPRYLSYTRSDPLLVNNRIVKRPFKQQYNSLGLTSGKFLKVTGLEDAMRAARRTWAAEHIQSLFHLQRAYDDYYRAVLDRSAVGLQRIWRGHRARLANAEHRAQARRHRAASRLAAFGRGIRQRKALRGRIREVWGDAASGDWAAYWSAAAVQRRCGGVLYASLYSSDVDADVELGGLAVCDGDFALAQELFFERALRMWPAAPRPRIVYALAKMEFTDDYEGALALLATAASLGSVAPKFYAWLEERQSARAVAAVRLQRMWRHTRTRPRYSFYLATEMACAQRAIDLGVATVEDWEAHVFGLHALHRDEMAAADLYARTLLRKYPARTSFRLGHAVLHRLDTCGPVDAAADLGILLRFFRHACSTRDAHELAPALANLGLLYWYLGARQDAERMVRRALALAPDCSSSLEVFYVFRRAEVLRREGSLPDNAGSLSIPAESGVGNMSLQSALRAALERRLKLERAAEKRVQDEIATRAREREEMAKHDKPPPSLAKQRTLRESIMTQSQIAEARRKAKQDRRKSKKRPSTAKPRKRPGLEDTESG